MIQFSITIVISIKTYGILLYKIWIVVCGISLTHNFKRKYRKIYLFGPHMFVPYMVRVMFEVLR